MFRMKLIKSLFLTSVTPLYLSLIYGCSDNLLKTNDVLNDTEIVTKIQESRNNYDGIVINAAGFTHTSVAIRDALDIFKKPIIELHISNIYKREEFRKKSLISDIVTGGIFGLGSDGYILAIISMQKLLRNEN